MVRSADASVSIATASVSGVGCSTHAVDSVRALPLVRVHTPRKKVGVETKNLRFALSADDLHRLPGSTAADVLRAMPAVWVRSLGGYGAATTVGTRGLGAAHTAVMVDGFPLGDAESGTVDVARFAPQQLEGLLIDVGDAPQLLTPVRTLGAATLHFISPQRPLRLWATMGAFGYRSAGGSANFSNSAVASWASSVTTPDGNCRGRLYSMRCARANA